jgi:cbb3-type cytochrome oxidase subunit 3
LAVVALAIFVVAFIGLLLWVMRKSGKEYYEKMRQLPMDDDQEKPGRSKNE